MELNGLEHFLRKIRQGQMLLGCCITLDDPAVSEIAAEAGMDFCWIDCEHGILDRRAVMEHLMALRGTGCAPLIRVPVCDHTEIKKVIDLAPAGIIVPMVNTAEQAALAVAACRYPPEGNRGCGFRRGFRYGAEEFAVYWENSRHDPLVIAQIEHIEAVKNLGRILTVPGLDGICIGPGDLSASCGCPMCFDAPELARLLDEICRQVHDAGKLLGAYSETDRENWRRRGVQWLGVSNDTGALFHYFRNLQK